MDGAVWVGAVFGLVGTGIGGGLSIWASIAAQRYQARANRELVIAQRVDAAADAAIQMFSQVKQHVRGRPSESEPGAAERIKIWEKSLQKQVNKLEPTLLRIRDPEFRSRLKKVAEYLVWTDTLKALGESPIVFSELCDHALDCLGAFVRDEPLPPENKGMAMAREVEADYLAIMEDLAREMEETRGMGYH